MTGGHGHVTPRLDGAKARCGGPAICAACAVEKAQYDASRLRVADMIAPTVSDAQELAEHIATVERYVSARLAAESPSCTAADDRAAEDGLAAVQSSARRLMGMPDE
jgi:hypothetical protein